MITFTLHPELAAIYDRLAQIGRSLKAAKRVKVEDEQGEHNPILMKSGQLQRNEETAVSATDSID